MDRNYCFMPCQARKIYAGRLPYIRKRVQLSRLLFAVVLATLILAAMVEHDRQMELDCKDRLIKAQVVQVCGGLIWIQEPEETGRVMK